MNTVKVSTKYQVLIPAEVRKLLGVKPGDKFKVMTSKGDLEFVPVKPIRQMRGFLKGMNTQDLREKE